jgi:hypothetical protein
MGQRLVDNLKAHPATNVKIHRMSFTPVQRLLTADEAYDVIRKFRTRAEQLTACDNRTASELAASCATGLVRRSWSFARGAGPLFLLSVEANHPLTLKEES